MFTGNEWTDSASEVTLGAAVRDPFPA